MIFIIYFLVFYTTQMCAQQVQFKIVCEEHNCTIHAFNEQNMQLGFAYLNKCHLYRLQVTREFERQGVAKSLLKQACTQAKKNGCKQMDLYSLKSLLSFYQHNEFTCDENQRCTHPV